MATSGASKIGVVFGDHPIWEGLADMPRPRGWGSYQDPVMGYLSLPPLLRQAMDLRAVQRLRSIRQNSGLELVFPGATHTRFEHSVGVMWLAGQAHDTLEHKRLARVRDERKPEWPTLGVATKLAVMFAALFHDVGHGPYSHTHEEYQKREASLGRRHEERSFTIIDADDRDIKLFLYKVHAQLKDVAQADLVLPANVAALAQAGVPSAELDAWTFLGSIVKGDVDVDRLDYLRRDAFHTGVPIGIDPGEMIAAYVLAEVSSSEEPYLRLKTEQAWQNGDPEPTGPFKWTLKLEARIALAVERMLSTRDLAYRAMYYHPTNRVVQEMLILAMQRLTRRPPEEDAATKAAPSDLDEMTDGELIENVNAADPLLQRLYTGLRDRRLFEPIGCQLRVAGWPHGARTELSDLRETGSIRLRRRMRSVAEAVGLELLGRSPGRVIADITNTPVVDELAYRNRMFWDGEGQHVAWPDDRFGGSGPAPRRASRVGHSLLELHPHLRARHGALWRDDGSKRDLHLEYMQEIQLILFFVPPEFLDDVHGLIRGREGSERETACDEVFARKLEPILRGLWDEVYTSDNFPDAKKHAGGWDPSFEEAAGQLRTWLRSDAFPIEGSRRS
jgi:HD superfamily phosphohydrolase